MDNQNLFGQTYGLDYQALGGKNFQLLASPIDFSWTTAPEGQMKGQTSSQAYQIVSVMPKYSPIGGYTSSNTTFFDSYKKLFNYITYDMNPAKQNDLQDLEDQLVLATNKLHQAAVENGKDTYLKLQIL